MRYFTNTRKAVDGSSLLNSKSFLPVLKIYFTLPQLLPH